MKRYASNLLSFGPAAFLGLSLGLGLVACESSAPPPVDPSQASGSNAATMGKTRTPSFDELALKEAQLQRDHSLAAAKVEETSEAATQGSPAAQTTAPRNITPKKEGTTTQGTAEANNAAATGATGEATAAVGGAAPAAATSPVEPGKRVTAMDQRNKPTDIKITQDIRKAVIADPTLSTAAKNVTVVTIDGRVTLMGKVKDKAERDNVASKAKRYAGEGRVDDRLEIAK